MARRIHLQPYLSVDELEHRYRTAKEPNERTWWQILWLLAQGWTATELSAVIGYRSYWIGQIAKRFNEQGPGEYGVAGREQMVDWFGEGREHLARHGCPLLAGGRDAILRSNIRTQPLATTTVATTPSRQEEPSI
jgi:hypothetical protein